MSAAFEHLTLDELSLRDMGTEDLSKVIFIEQAAHISPWSRLSFEESLTRNEQSANCTHPCRVLEARGEVVGYHILNVVVDELHILNVACAPKVQGLGLGHCLMQDIIDISHRRQLPNIFLEVRISNLVAQGLYEKWGFKQISLRKRYYRPVEQGGEREDALVYLRS